MLIRISKIKWKEPRWVDTTGAKVVKVLFGRMDLWKFLYGFVEVFVWMRGSFCLVGGRFLLRPTIRLSPPGSGTLACVLCKCSRARIGVFFR